MNGITVLKDCISVEVCGEEIKFVSIKHGDFFMPGKGRTVSLVKDYWMQETAVTQQQYRAVCKEAPAYFKGNDLPVESVSWHEAKAFCTRLNALLEDSLPEGYSFDLPTGAQWEHACLAGNNSDYSFGKRISYKDANFDARSCLLPKLIFQGIFGPKDIFRRGTVPVKSFPSNKFGLFEMHGNVCEWCRDPERIFEDKDLEFLSKGDAATNNATMALVKGGGWRSNWLQCACSCNNYYSITCKSKELGFRVAIVSRKR